MYEAGPLEVCPGQLFVVLSSGCLTASFMLLAQNVSVINKGYLPR